MYNRIFANCIASVAAVVTALIAVLDRRGPGRCRSEALVQPDCGGIRGVAGGAGPARRGGPTDPSPDAAAHRYGGLARDFFRAVHRSPARGRARCRDQRGATPARVLVAGRLGTVDR